MHLKDDMNPQDQNEDDFLRELSPNLFVKKLGMEDDAPEGYFEEFPDKVMARIERGTHETKQRTIATFINFRTLSIAAGLALILAITPYLKSVFQDNRNTTETIASTDFNLEEMDSEVLSSYFDEEDLYASIDPENLSVPLSETDSDLIIDYLIDEGMSDQFFLESTNNDVP